MEAAASVETLARRRDWAHGVGLALALVPFVLYHAHATRLPMPGVLDPLYYHHVAQALESGGGLAIEYVWNYGEKPATLAHAANAYWGPVPSVLMALGHIHPGTRPWPPRMLLVYLGAAFLATALATRRLRWPGRRAGEPGGESSPYGLAVLAAPALALLDWMALAGPSTPLHPHVEAMLSVAGVAVHLGFVLAMTIFRSASVAGAAAAFMLFCYPFTYFATTTDSPVPFAATVNLALLAALAAGRMGGVLAPAVAGALAALAALTRAEGVFLVGFSGLHLALGGSAGSWRQRSLRLIPLLLGFLLVMGPWWARNLSVFSTPAPASLGAAITMTDYNQLFLWNPPPARGLSLQAATDLAREKLRALLASARTLLMGDLGVLMLLVPFGLPAALATPAGRLFASFAAFQFLVLSLCFSFQTLNGTFLHSVIALYPFLLACAASGVLTLGAQLPERLHAPGPRRLAHTLGRAALPVLLAYLAAGWWRSTAGDTQLRDLLADTRQTFLTLDAWTREHLPPDAPLLTNLPFETYHYTRRPCAILPRDDDFAAIDAVARRYGIGHAVILDNPKYLRHPMAADRIPLTPTSALTLLHRIPLPPGPARFREIRIYRLDR
ncbi:MAG: hypothetical protein HYY25_04980, partial [Candidatus Wallbacteria bacterium]|nr:hypothetical protein [Candidatus Wallbacteria bacterium]